MIVISLAYPGFGFNTMAEYFLEKPDLPTAAPTPLDSIAIGSTDAGLVESSCTADMSVVPGRAVLLFTR